MLNSAPLVRSSPSPKVKSRNEMVDEIPEKAEASITLSPAPPVNSAYSIPDKTSSSLVAMPLVEERKSVFVKVKLTSADSRKVSVPA